MCVSQCIFPSLTLTLLSCILLLYLLLCVISFTCGSLSESHSGCSRVLALDGYLQHGGVPFCKVRAVNSSQFSVLTLDYFYFYLIFSSFPLVHNFFISLSLYPPTSNQFSTWTSIIFLAYFLSWISILILLLYHLLSPTFPFFSRRVSLYFLKIRTLEVLAQILETLELLHPESGKHQVNFSSRGNKIEIFFHITCSLFLLNFSLHFFFFYHLTFLCSILLIFCLYVSFLSLLLFIHIPSASFLSILSFLCIYPDSPVPPVSHEIEG